MGFLYKFALYSFAIEQVAKLVPTIFRTLFYFYLYGIFLNIAIHGFSYVNNIGLIYDPYNIFWSIYNITYDWWWLNKTVLGFYINIKMLFLIILPYFVIYHLPHHLYSLSITLFSYVRGALYKMITGEEYKENKKPNPVQNTRYAQQQEYVQQQEYAQQQGYDDNFQGFVNHEFSQDQSYSREELDMIKHKVLKKLENKLDGKLLRYKRDNIS